MQNFQPKLSKVGSQLAFSNGNCIEDVGNELEIKKEGQSSNLKANVLNCKNLETTGKVHVGDNSNAYITGNSFIGKSVFLNCTDPLLSADGCGINVATGYKIDQNIIISGLNTSTVVLSGLAENFSTIASIVVTTGTLNLTFFVLGCSDTEEIVEVFKENSIINNLINFTYSDDSISLTTKDNSIITGLNVYDYVVNGIIIDGDKWVINNGIAISQTGISGNEILLDSTGQVLLNQNYTPTLQHSVANKQYVDSMGNNSSILFPKGLGKGITLLSGGFTVDMTKGGSMTDTTPIGDFSLVFPYFNTVAGLELFKMSSSNQEYIKITTTEEDSIIYLNTYVEGSSVSKIVLANDYSQISLAYDSLNKDLYIYIFKDLTKVEDVNINMSNISTINLFTVNGLADVNIFGDFVIFNSMIDVSNVSSILYTGLYAKNNELGAYFNPINSGELKRGKIYTLDYSTGDFTSCGMQNESGEQLCTTTNTPTWGNSSAMLYGAVLDLQFDKQYTPDVITDMSHQRNAICSGIFNFNSVNNINIG